jgi:hypothetical protein
MPGVFLCSPTNSTMFTTCCKVAICDDQQKCPRCTKDVYPFYEGMSQMERDEAHGGYHHHNTRRARWNQAYRGRR